MNIRSACLFQMSTDERCTRLTDLHAKSLVNDHDTFLFDCDGVLWNFPEIFPGAIELLHHLTGQVEKRDGDEPDEY